MQEKTDLRTKFKAERKKINIKLASDEIVKTIRSEEFYQSAKNVMMFYPLKYEIDLLSLLEDDKQFYFPRVEGENLLVCPYEKDCTFEKSSLRISEPCTNPVDADVLDLIFVPALAVDKAKYRLGYGGGFYDRFLKSTEALKVVPICEDFVVETLPREVFDEPVDLIITNGKRPTVK